MQHWPGDERQKKKKKKSYGLSAEPTIRYGERPALGQLKGRETATELQQESLRLLRLEDMGAKRGNAPASAASSNGVQRGGVQAWDDHMAGGGAEAALAESAFERRRRRQHEAGSRDGSSPRPPARCQPRKTAGHQWNRRQACQRHRLGRTHTRHQTLMRFRHRPSGNFTFII